MPKTTPVPTDFAVGSTVSFKAGPSQVLRTGTVKAHEPNFILVDLVEGEKTRTVKTRPGAILD